MIIGARLKERIDAKPTTQAALARAIGVSPQAVSKMVTGGTTDSSKVYQIARFLETTPEYLSGETDDPASHEAIGEGGPNVQVPPTETSELDGMVMVKEADLVLGFGGAFLDSPVEERMIPFPKDWLRQFSDAPVENLVFIRGRGESMKPTVLDGDICLLDLGRKRLDEQDELWAVAFGNIGMVKRLRGMPDGTVKIMSDNPVVGEEVAGDGELFIIGRCCGVFRKT